MTKHMDLAFYQPVADPGEPGVAGAGVGGATGKKDSREALVDTAEGLFISSGYANVSTRQIADAAGVNLGLIQYHFGGKAKLFIEVLRRIKDRGRYTGAELVLAKVPATAQEAGEQLCAVVRAYLESVLRPTGPQTCRLVHREVLATETTEPELYSSLVHTVADEFVGPFEASLAKVLTVLRPELAQTCPTLAAQSVMALCSFYFTHRPFLERCHGHCLAAPGATEEIARHVAGFAMRGLGCEHGWVDGVLLKAFGPAEPAENAHEQRT